MHLRKKKVKEKKFKILELSTFDRIFLMKVSNILLKELPIIHRQQFLEEFN